jgi:hypothetical protein
VSPPTMVTAMSWVVALVQGALGAVALPAPGSASPAREPTRPNLILNLAFAYMTELGHCNPLVCPNILATRQVRACVRVRRPFGAHGCPDARDLC